MTDRTPACEGCGLPYGSAGWVDVVIPDPIWNTLDAGLLCFTCMTKALIEHGHSNVPVLVASGPYVCDQEKWRLIGLDHGYNIGLEDAAEIAEGWVDDDAYPSRAIAQAIRAAKK